MKIKVNRLLSGGKYYIDFEVSDFTPEELGKMSSFGVPSVPMRWSVKDTKYVANIAINQINKTYRAAFDSEKDAETYEQFTLNAIKAAIQQLRDQKDTFSSSDEVDF